MQPAPWLTDGLFGNTPKGAESPSRSLYTQCKIHIPEWEKSARPIPEVTPTMRPIWSEGRAVPQRKTEDFLASERVMVTGWAKPTDSPPHTELASLPEMILQSVSFVGVQDFEKSGCISIFPFISKGFQFS